MSGRPGHTAERLLPVGHPTVQDICWAAGIYEGEGSVKASGVRAGPLELRGSLYVMVSQKSDWLLLRLKHLFGGAVHRYNRKDGTTDQHWQINGTLARGFVMTIYKFLSPRRKLQIWRAMYPELHEINDV